MQSAPPDAGASHHDDGARPFAITGGERWYVAQTLPRREVGAGLQLKAQGFRPFLPQVSKTVRHARQSRTVRSALFPRYLFVILDLDRDRWRAVNGTIGVSSLLMANGRPEPVPRGVVEALLALADGSNLLRFEEEFQVGQSVRVLAGPFADAIGRLDRLEDNGRVRILLEIMGREVPAVLDRRHLERPA